MGDLELGDLLLAGVSGRVRGDVRGSALAVDMLPTCFTHVQAM